MSDYISRDAAMAVAEDAQKKVCPLGLWGRIFALDKEQYDLWQDLIERLEAIPAADVEPVRRGKWEPGNPICPVCGKDKFKDLDADIWSDWTPTYCPNCGAILNGGKNENGV